MKLFFISCLVISSLILSACSEVTNKPQPQTLVVIADASDSAPVMLQPHFKAQVIKRLNQTISELPMLSYVHTRVIGLPLNDTNEALAKEYKITIKMKPTIVRQQVSKLFEKLSDGESQNQSALTSSLVDLVKSLGCTPQHHYALISDGMNYIAGQPSDNAYKLIQSHSGNFTPASNPKLFAGGCRLSVWGVGRVSRNNGSALLPNEKLRLEQLWHQWWQASGGSSETIELLSVL